MATKDDGSVSCDECSAVEDASVHMHQNLRGSGADVCQPCLRAALEHLLMTGPDRTFFRRLDAWAARTAVAKRPPS